jgi:hypothetical protein
MGLGSVESFKRAPPDHDLMDRVGGRKDEIDNNINYLSIGARPAHVCAQTTIELPSIPMDTRLQQPLECFPLPR